MSVNMNLYNKPGITSCQISSHIRLRFVCPEGHIVIS